MGSVMEPRPDAAGPSNPEIKTEIKIEPKIEPKEEPYIKEEPQDDWPMIISETSRPLKPPKPKKEEDEGPKLDNVLPVPGDMFEDVDGEDDVEYVDHTFEGIAHVNGVRHFVCEGFKIRQVPEPLVVKRSLHDLNACILARSIVLDPDFQREQVWDEGRCALLITSILMGYFIPPIIFNIRKNTPEIGIPSNVKIVRICVDGKQRLTSIWKFMTGRIGFFDSSTPQRKWYFCYRKDHQGNTIIDNRNILPKAVRDHFQKQYFCCYEYDELDRDTEETMFQLVQKGIALTSAEKMRAISSEWANFARQYEEDYELIVNLSKQARASGFRLILTIFAMIQEVLLGGFASTRIIKRPATSKTMPILQASPTALTRLLEDKRPIPEDLKGTIRAIFDKYETLVKLSSQMVTTTRWRIRLNSTFDPNPSWLDANHSRTFSPLEFLGTAILITVLMDYRSDIELLSDVRGFRKFLRETNKDLRVNSQCWVLCWTYISEQMDLRQGQRKDPGSVPPEEVEEDADVNKKLSVEAFLFARAHKHRKENGEGEGRSRSSSLSHLPSDLDYDSGDQEGDDLLPRRPGRGWAKGLKRGPSKKVKEKETDTKAKPKTNGTAKGKNKRPRQEEEDDEESDPEIRKLARKLKKLKSAKHAPKKKLTRRRKTPAVDEDVDDGTEFPNLEMGGGVGGGGMVRRGPKLRETRNSRRSGSAVAEEEGDGEVEGDELGDLEFLEQIVGSEGGEDGEEVSGDGGEAQGERGVDEELEGVLVKSAEEAERVSDVVAGGDADAVENAAGRWR